MTTGTVVKALASSEPTGIRTEIICSYDIPRLFYQHVKGSARLSREHTRQRGSLCPRAWIHVTKEEEPNER